MGCGHYGAPRGDRLHRGVDKVADVDEYIHTPIKGKVSKLGYCYSDDLSFRYVQITDANHFNHRFMYVYPLVEVNDMLDVGDIIGNCQDIAGKWGGGMKNHIHYEIKKGGEYYDPEEFE